MNHGKEQHIEQEKIQPLKEAAAGGNAVEIIKDEECHQIFQVGNHCGQEDLELVAEPVPEAAAGVLGPDKGFGVAFHVLGDLLDALLIGCKDFLPHVPRKGGAVQHKAVVVPDGIVHHRNTAAHSVLDHCRQLETVDLLHGGDMVEGLPHLRGNDGFVGQLHGVLDEQHGEYIPVACGDASAFQGLQTHGTAGVCLRLSPLGDPVDVVKAQDTDFKALW